MSDDYQDAWSRVGNEMLKLSARMGALERVAEAARILRVDGKGLSIAQANARLDDALEALDALNRHSDSPNFDAWAATNPPKKTDLGELRDKVEANRHIKDKK